MDRIIEKVYVINMKHRQDRWRKINQDFKDTSLRLDRWEATNGKELTDQEIKESTTMACYNLCSSAMIGIWLSHCRLWKYIAENNLDNVLILEDDAYPVKNFDKILLEKFRDVPNDWDMVFFGCFGSCDESTSIDSIVNLFFDRQNKVLTSNVLEPSLPLGFHAYLISNKGAQKLINHPVFQKVSYHIDYIFSKNVLLDSNFKVYSIRPNLIKQHDDSSYSDNLDNIHPFINIVGSKIKLSENHNADTLLSTQVAYVRKLGISLTIYNCLLFIFSLIFGFFFGKYLYLYLGIIFSIYALELLIYRGRLVKIRNLVIEIIFVIAGAFIGKYLANILFKSKIRNTHPYSLSL